MKWNPFVKSGTGILEYEICKLLSKTPGEIGDLRKSDPISVYFLESSIVQEYERKVDAHKRASKASKAKRRK